MFSDEFFLACELTDDHKLLVLTASCFKIQSTFEDDVHILASKEIVLRSRLYFRNVIELEEFGGEVASQFDRA